MTSRLTKYEKETVLLYNQSQDPITISTYDPGLRRRLREFAARYPDLCRRVDKQKYPDYAEYEIQKDRVSIRLLPPMSEEKRKVASEKAKAAGLGTRNITWTGHQSRRHRLITQPVPFPLLAGKRINKEGGLR